MSFLVEEVTLASEVHGDAGSLCCFDNLGVALGPTRLDNRLDSAIDQNLQSIGEWEECV
jgi:hypothetical protein